MFDYADCAAAISYSQSNNMIAVAFRGSAALTQILEQVLQFLTGMTSFTATGGKVSMSRIHFLAFIAVPIMHKIFLHTLDFNATITNDWKPPKWCILIVTIEVFFLQTRALRYYKTF